MKNNNNLIWNYTMNTKQRSTELSKRVNNKRYINKQIRVINACKSNLIDLKEIIQKMFLVDNIENYKIEILQKNLKDINCVKKFIEEFKKFQAKLGFSPYIIF